MSLAVLLLMQTSCVPTRKVRYLQGVAEQDSFKVDMEPRVLHANDYINIVIKSIDDRYDAMFTMTAPVFNNFNTDASDIFYLSGYHINDSGDVTLPLVGKIKIGEKTLEEAQRIVADSLKKYVNIVYVTIKVGGIRYTVIGEVRSPGKFTILQNSVTIFEALARAGDLTEYAKRNEIVIVRRVSSDQLKIVKVNLLDASGLNNYDYFIQSDDIIYVMPLKIKQAGFGTSGYQTFASLLTTATSLLVFYNVFIK